MTSTEIHVRISLNRNFATMSHLLVRSLAAKAGFPGDWRVVFTVSLDTEEDFSSPLLDWAKDYPVEFRWVDRALFEAYGYNGTRLHGIMHEHTADVVLIMDADLLAVGPLTDLIEEAAAAEAVIARPGWAPPPDVDLAQLFAARGVIAGDYGIDYEGYGIAFTSPRRCPAYFSFGHVALPRSIARHMAGGFADDVAFVERRHRSFFNDQVALCLHIVRSGYRCRAMASKFNLGNGEAPGFRFSEDPDAALAYARIPESLFDRRIIHYAIRTPEFDKTRDFDGLDRVRAFCARTDLRGVTNILLQAGLRAIL